MRKLAAAILSAALPLVLAPATAKAATLTLAGTVPGLVGDDNDEVDSWRTTSVVKTLDLDNDNIYGTAGYVLFAADDIGNGNAGIVQTGINPFTYVNGTRRTIASIPIYLSFNVNTSGTGVASSYGYRPVDDPTAVPGATVPNLESGAFLRNTALNTEISLFDMVIGADFPSGGLRLGLFHGNTDAYNGVFRIEQTVGGTGNVSANQTSGVIQLSFFDITGAAPGDTFRVYATKNAASGNTNVLLGGLTFDAIPEPASATTLLAGLATLLAGTRRRRF